MIRLGKTLHSSVWHIIREDGTPACGYMSFPWACGDKEVITIDGEDLSSYRLCKNCRILLQKRQRVKRKQGRGKSPPEGDWRKATGGTSK